MEESADTETSDEIDSNDDLQDAYKAYCMKESDDTYTAIGKNQEEYDKQLLALSTGLLAVLIAFLKDVVHMDSSIYRPILYLGFASLGITISCVMVSFQISIYVLEQVRVYWKKQYAGETKYPFPDRLSKVVTYSNLAGGVFFIAGVALALIFIVLNLAHQSR
jgi:hypothetical protein